LTPNELQIGRKPIKERTKQPADALPHALNHWIRLEAISILHQGEFSAGEVAEMIGEDVRYVTGHIRDLYEAGCIEFVDYKLIGNRMRPVFRAVVLPIITDDVYRTMSRDERYDAAGAMTQGFLAETLSAYRNHKMDGDEPPCLMWDAPPLDAEGRRKLRVRMIEIWEEEVLTIQGESANRIAESGEEPIPTVVGLFSFQRGRPEESKIYYRPQSGTPKWGKT
jgi:DNA-binding transcriptional ArsR family regulator